MSSLDLLLLANVELEVTRIFTDEVSTDFRFHSIAHTQRVVSAVKEIVASLDKGLVNTQDLLLAAWLHDTGFATGRIEEHELASVDIAQATLRRLEVDEENITSVCDLIMATKMPQQPHTFSQMILCDADLFHLGGAQFSSLTELLRQEMEIYIHRTITKDEWDRNNISFLMHHHYFTEYCQQYREPIKKNWIELIKQEQERI